MKLTDQSKMPFGKFAGDRLQDVPASYLLWLADELGKSPADPTRAALRAYIDDNRRCLEQEAEAGKSDDE